MSTDITFITNNPGEKLLDRFKVLIKDTKFFDCLVAYFYTTGFYELYESFEKTEKIRILIGISTNTETLELINKSTIIKENENLSHNEIKENYGNNIQKEFEETEEDKNIELGVQTFIKWLKTGKIEVRAYPSKNIHAKLYIITFQEGDRDVGRVITGSSNFTKAGLIDNLEFNVELKNRADYEFAKQKFEELWEKSVDVSDIYIETIENKTWLNNNITPYELYLKFLYEYFREDLGQTKDLNLNELPKNFVKLQYQEQAVLNAKRILEEYGGVFISDVVGLGKTYITAMLLKQLDGRTLIVAPPSLINENNPGSWRNILADFNVAADYLSIGKLEDFAENQDIDRYKNVVVDEAHRFRTETTQSYELLAEICRGKRVILVSATPYNNTPKDILSLIKLFQNSRKSTIPNLPDIESFINKLQNKLKYSDRKEDYDEYLRIVKENAKEIREKLLKFLMVRRTRKEIEKYFSEDLKKQNINFPDIKAPIPFYYEFNELEEEIFDKTVEALTTRIKYARYKPLTYLREKISQAQKVSQENMGGFMKVLLIKRLESSFYAFKRSIDRFIHSYEMFIKEFKNGYVYISKKYANKIFDYIENDDDEAIEKLLNEGKAERYEASEFEDNFYETLINDYEILKEIKEQWKKINRDPKLKKLLSVLKNNEILKNNKIIIFTESKETAEYLGSKINEHFGKNIALVYTGSSSGKTRDEVIENFDPKAKYKKDEFRILVATEVLAEGVNLHRSNVVINYDIPWNPTKIIQRVGRINRVDTKFKEIYTFNFFPTIQSNDEIKLKEIAREKIHAFLTLLGGDAAILTEGEPVASHELFDRLLSKPDNENDESEESELKYFKIIKDIQEKNPELFNKIKKLPKKARSAKASNEYDGFLLTYFRKGKLDKFYIVSNNNTPLELDFTNAAKIMECNEKIQRIKLANDFYELLRKNKEAFNEATKDEITIVKRRGKDLEKKLVNIAKAVRNNAKALTEDQEDYLNLLIERLEDGAIPRPTLKNILKNLAKLENDLNNPLKILSVFQIQISDRFLKSHYVENSGNYFEKSEVILSLYLGKE